MTERSEAISLYAIRLSADVLTALVATGALSKKAAAALIDDGLSNLLETYPEMEEDFRDMAGAVSAQVGLVSLDIERQLKRDREA